MLDGLVTVVLTSVIHSDQQLPVRNSNSCASIGPRFCLLRLICNPKSTNVVLKFIFSYTCIYSYLYRCLNYMHVISFQKENTFYNLNKFSVPINHVFLAQYCVFYSGVSFYVYKLASAIFF